MKKKNFSRAAGPPVISVVGSSNSGKTTFLEKLLPELKKRGYAVGVIKHAHHSFEIDYEGKDSYRLFAAGARAVVLSSAGKIALIKKQEEEMDIDALVKNYFTGLDLVLTEGYKNENKPKIEINREGAAKTLLCREDELLALLTDNPVLKAAMKKKGVRVFSLSRAGEIADLIEAQYLKKRYKTK